MSYDEGNVFARILRDEVSCKRLYEDEHALAFQDVHPQAPTHLVVIPKGAYTSFDDFSARASADEVAGFFRAVGHVARQQGLEEEGYRLIANHGGHAFQEVPHFHVYLLGGRPLGPIVQRWTTDAPARRAAEDDLTLYFAPHDGDASHDQIEALARLLDLETYEASLILGRSPLPRVIRRGPTEDVRGLAQRLDEIGLPAAAVETNALLFNLEPWVVRGIEVEGEGDAARLTVVGEGDERIELPDARSALLVRGQYAYIPDKPKQERMPAWTSGGRRGKSTTHMPRLQRVPFGHLYLAGEPRPFAFVASEIRDYRFLGDDMASSAHANFELLMGLLAERPQVLPQDAMHKHQVQVKSCVEAFWDGTERPEAATPDLDAEVMSRLVYYSTVVTAEPSPSRSFNGGTGPA